MSLSRSGALAFCLIAILVLTGTASAAQRVVEGSSLVQRTMVDGDSGQVYVYTGGSFPAGTHLTSFRYLFDFVGPQGNPTGYITPLLFLRVQQGDYVLYTVAGIGQGFHAALSPTPRTILFHIVTGIKIPRNSVFTFGFINAIVDANGIPGLSSPGTVDMDRFPQSGDGAGGPGTNNNWGVTAQGPPFPVVTLGTTFGVYGSGADYDFFEYTRTYSAEAFGVVGDDGR